MMKSFLEKRVHTRMFSIGGIAASSLIVLFIFTSKPAARMSTHSLLCLGDSYTIGESVEAYENFPKQSVLLLNNDGYNFNAPEIIAMTGWTTDELEDAIDETDLKNSFDFVTLLVGVNDQYRGRKVEEYKPRFESLLKRAIQFANGQSSRVIVLSIPDWGVTPFAKDRDPGRIAQQINSYNEVNKQLALEYKVEYIDITASTREAISDRSLVASDGLHPSAKEYSKWAAKIYLAVKEQLH
jgi:lysophospholipase L1-like esterase